MARGHAEALMPIVDEILRESGTAFGALDLIAATTGPGSFTGVRIAISAARGLALVTEAKLFGTDSLTVMARRAHDLGATGGRRSPSPSMRTRRCSISASMARRARGAKVRCLSRPTMPRICFRAACGRPSRGRPPRRAAGRRGAPVRRSSPDLEPNAAALAALAEESGETVPTLRPFYLRPPDSTANAGSSEAMPDGFGAQRA